MHALKYLIIGLVKEVHGTYKIKHHLMGNPDKVYVLLFHSYYV